MTSHILLIDDDQEDAELFSEALDELQMEAIVTHFYDGNKALELLGQQNTPPPHIIFLDINMPHINGWDCLRALKSIAQLKKIPIVMYSTSSFDKQMVEPADVGASAYLTKPGHFGALKAELFSLLTKLLPA